MKHSKISLTITILILFNLLLACRLSANTTDLDLQEEQPIISQVVEDIVDVVGMEDVEIDVNQDNDKYFHPEMTSGMYILYDDHFEPLEKSNRFNFFPQDINHFSPDSQPIISIIRTRQVVESNIPVNIVNHFGEKQPSITLYDDGNRVSIQPSSPLKDGVYFIVDEYFPFDSKTIYFFYIWEEQNEKLSNIGKYFSQFDLSSLNELTYYVYDQVSLIELTSKDFSDIPSFEEGTLAFIDSGPRNTIAPLRLLRFMVLSDSLGIKIDTHTCNLTSVNALGINYGFQINDQIYGINDVIKHDQNQPINLDACSSLRRLLYYQTMDRPFSITVRRGNDIISLQDITLPSDIDSFEYINFWSIELGIAKGGVNVIQAKIPLIDGLYCLDYAGILDLRYCFWKR